MVTVPVCSKLTENGLFLQIESRIIHDISWAFLIKQLFVPLALTGYEMIIANSALRASLAIYHLISNAYSWNDC